MAFTKAISQAASDALEVPDRWHLLKNLSTAADKSRRGHLDCLRLDRIGQRHREVNELAVTGMSLSAIGRRLRLDRKAVRHYRNRPPAVPLPGGLHSSMQLYRE